MASLKTQVDQLDIDKLVPFPVDLSNLSDIVKNDVVKTNVYDKIVAKVNSIDTSALVLKSMILINQNKKVKFLILAVLLKRQITILEPLK